MESGLNDQDWNEYTELLNKAKYKDLVAMQEDLEKEMRLSQEAIAEGFEDE